MSKSKIPKTNALRLLDHHGITYEVRTYEAPDGFLDGVSVARQVGMNPAEVFKTLVLQGTTGEYCVCVIPVECTLDLKKAARHFGQKKVEMIPAREIKSVTGYIKGGCSPIGMKKLFKTAIASQAESMEQITVSAGKVGLQVTLPTKALQEIVKAEFADLT
ncbi:MAG: Cys-tRNA(Pro) deacylase [Syntrophomonadaceae bacterium]|nr:Cys-tRNA(Pro) deacylase [Syntrophomonadaceae bacterium]